MAKAQSKLAVQTAGLTKIFRDFWGHQKVIAVDQLDLEIGEQEVFGLLGPNGSGKSTTIKMLLGLLFPTKGWSRVLGNPPGDVKTNSRIGFLPEESYLYPFLNARETLDFYGRLFGLPAKQRKGRIESLLDMVGLSSVSRRPIGEYSKGMIRRIGLAQALINDPDLLILDEPTSGLDPIGTRQIKDLISELGKRGKTVLLSSHLLADVEDVCDRICILYGGKEQDAGSVQELLARSELTQISSGNLDGNCLDKIKEVILASHPDYTIKVETPRDRLEDYFLRTVGKAQAQEIATSGAMMGKGVSDFLGQGEREVDATREVIDQLVSGKEPEVAPSEPQTTAVTPKPVAVEDVVQHEVIDSLVEGGGQRQEQDLPAAGVSGTTASLRSTTEPVEIDTVFSEDQQVDRSVIDDLLGDSKQAPDGETSSDDSVDDVNGPQEGAG